MAKAADSSPVAQGLRFFGQATAGVTHEIKNCLALINEFNGLIGDLIQAHEKGHPLNLERIKSLVGDIKRQVASGGEITANLNRFAHSADEEWDQVELGAHLRLFAALAQRSLHRRGASLEVTAGDAPRGVRTRPMLLLLAWQQALEATLGGQQGGGVVRVRLREEPGWAWADFSLEGASGGRLPGPGVEPGLRQALGAREEPAPGGLSLGLPSGQDQ